jgi:tetratricopeptide (TPR) repeat protein
MAEAAGIFVSHAHEDNAWCRTFAEALRQAGANVWYRRDGVLGEEIEREVQARPIFILILSPAAQRSHWVQREVHIAGQLRRQNPERITVPVVIRRAEAPLLREDSKRVSGPRDTEISATEAAGWVMQTLGIVPAGAPAGTPPTGAETAAEPDTIGNGSYAKKQYEEFLVAYKQAQAASAAAQAAYERALALDPHNARDWYGKGMTLRDLERLEEALSAFEQALTLDPQYAAA